MKPSKEYDVYVYGAGWIVLSISAVLIFLYKGLGLDLFALLPPCVFHAATGYDCPGCGGSRAVHALLSGHPVKSALYHPFFFYATCVGGWFMLSQTIERISRGKLKIAMSYRDVYLWIAVALIAANWMFKLALKLFMGIDLLEVIARL
jgi:hypothetical protein